MQFKNRFKHWRIVLDLVLATALLLVAMRWLSAEAAVVYEHGRAATYADWLEKEKARRPAPVAPSCPAPVPCTCPPPPPTDPPTMCSGDRPLPNGICLDIEVGTGEHPTYEVAMGFHQPTGGWGYTTVLTSGGMLDPSLGMMSLSEYDWKLLRAGSRKPCPLGMAPCIWDQTRLLENGSGTMTSLWRTVEGADGPRYKAFVCTSLNWRE